MAHDKKKESSRIECFYADFVLFALAKKKIKSQIHVLSLTTYVHVWYRFDPQLYLWPPTKEYQIQPRLVALPLMILERQ